MSDKTSFLLLAQSDVVLGGYTVPKDTTVIRIGHSTSNDSCNFDSPEKFIPERWLRDSSERHSAHPFANIPWGHGARSIFKTIIHSSGFTPYFPAQVLHWQEVCPAGAVHDDGQDCAKVQDGTGGTPTWSYHQLCLPPR